MRLIIRMKVVEEKINTTKLEPCDEPAPLDSFFVNTERLNSLPSEEERELVLADEPFAEGEVSIAFPPIPFYKLLKTTVRFEHRVSTGGKDRRATNTPALPVTLSYVKKSHLPDDFIAARKSLYSGLRAVTKAVAEEQERALVGDTESADEVAGADAVAAFDAFLKASVRVQRGGRITSRQIWEVWAARWGADSKERVIAGVRFIDVSRRFRATFGATAAKDPTRIDGELQRYFSGYAI